MDSAAIKRRTGRVNLKVFIKPFYQIFRLLSYPLTLGDSNPLPRHYLVSRFTGFFSFIVTTLLWNIGAVGILLYLFILTAGVLLAVIFAAWGEEFEEDQ